MSEALSALDADYAYCETIVRRDDPDRWLASLFLPEGKRRYAHALYAFSLEIARVREVVSEPMLGEIRFQWWREALEQPDREDVRANPVAAAVTDVLVRFDLPSEHLLQLIDARQFDLFDDPMQSVDELEAYARATSSNLFCLTPMILEPETPSSGFGAASHGGTAYALTGLLRAFPWHAARGQCYVPLDILRRHGLERADAVSGRASPALLAALEEFRALARSHLEIFLTRIEGLPDLARPAFLPICLCEPYLRLMEGKCYDPFKTNVVLPQWRRQWALWRAAKHWQ
ncbi:Squalene/phytoene synthase [Methylocella silvestris BL2]|uniref:Squalene/phytoene synthase n=1 Tax=Methylocella silvestris (strain DSM 15510 / CIP 108128 / LMG 27833 / NCIMB 13906 / BL2) TaxID=395965 RepID=B8ETD3_METSB|nr:phytoene/squalene synthase family protein [Methylocella silvestris]ACK51775.1 Squalene/phytoene synthase [Methylocella silvestris BL2]